MIPQLRIADSWENDLLLAAAIGGARRKQGARSFQVGIQKKVLAPVIKERKIVHSTQFGALSLHFLSPAPSKGDFISLTKSKKLVPQSESSFCWSFNDTLSIWTLKFQSEWIPQSIALCHLHDCVRNPGLRISSARCGYHIANSLKLPSGKGSKFQARKITTL